MRLDFEESSGVLVGSVRYADTHGPPTRIDCAEYKDSSGAKIPYRGTLPPQWPLHYPDLRDPTVR